LSYAAIVHILQPKEYILGWGSSRPCARPWVQSSAPKKPKPYSNRLNEEAVVRIQLSSIKSDSKETYKNVKQCQSS
jgi:hypothetical protein